MLLARSLLVFLSVFVLCISLYLYMYFLRMYFAAMHVVFLRSALYVYFYVKILTFPLK